MKRLIIALISISLIFISCSQKKETTKSDSIDFTSLNITNQTEFSYAKQLSIDLYGDYSIVTLRGKDRYLIVPQDKSIPDNIPDDITVLKKPLNNTYLVSTSVMDFIAKIDAMDYLRFSGTKESDWNIPQAVSAMHDKKILYAGKYNAPDYEKLIAENCSLAIENTMIYHKPDVKEKLEELGIPVLVEYSGYENHPLGRLEWIKLYGHLFDRVKESEEYYSQQLQVINPIMNKQNTGLKVAFFYITTSGIVNVRKPNDYVSKMISLAGGNYVPASLAMEEENALSTVNMQMEDFYSSCVNADIIIYNGNISGEVDSVDDLLKKNKLFSDFKAVQNGNAYSVGKNLFQETTGIAEFIKDLNNIMNGNDTQLSYIRKLN